MTSPWPEDFATGSATARPWGFVSAEVRHLVAGEVCRPGPGAQRLVLIAGSLAIDGGRAVTAFGEPVDVALPVGPGWSVLALTEVKLVLYTEEKRKVWS